MKPLSIEIEAKDLVRQRRDLEGKRER